MVDSQRDSELQPPYAARFGGWLIYYEQRCAQVEEDFADTRIKTQEGFWYSKHAAPVRLDRMVPSESPFEPLHSSPEPTNEERRILDGGNYRSANAIAHCAITGPPEMVAAYGPAS